MNGHARIPQRMNRRALIKRLAFLTAAGTLHLAIPRHAEAAIKTLTVEKRTRATVLVTIEGYGVQPVSTFLGPNRTWTPRVNATAKNALVTARVGGFVRQKPVSFGGRAVTVHDRATTWFKFL